MSVVEIVAFVVAFAGAASKLLESSRPFWKLLPGPVATFLPSLVVMLPTLASQVGAATTTLDLVNAVVVALALLLPGAAAKHVSKSDDIVK